MIKDAICNGIFGFYQKKGVLQTIAKRQKETGLLFEGRHQKKMHQVLSLFISAKKLQIIKIIRMGRIHQQKHHAAFFF
jgi:hypothetical protein